MGTGLTSWQYLPIKVEELFHKNCFVLFVVHIDKHIKLVLSKLWILSSQ